MNAPTPIAFLTQPLREHQVAARSGVLAALDSQDRCQMIMACGSGKTRLGPEIALARGARTVVIYLPSLYLLGQTMPDWIRTPFPVRMSFLCVCSDRSITKTVSNEVKMTAEELSAEFNLSPKQVTTRTEDVRAFLDQPHGEGIRIVFATYQSCDVVSHGCPDGFTFDLGIYDEAHRTAGEVGAFGASLMDSHTPIRKRVFMTATPKHVDFCRRTKEGEGRVIYSMDDPVLYGPVAYRFPLRQAIRLGIVADYRLIVSVVDDRMLAQDSISGQVAVKGEGIDVETMAHALAIRHAMTEYGLKKALTFHPSVADAKRFTDKVAVQRELGADMFHVNGDIPTNVRRTILETFARADLAVVTNSRCMTEGVNVPEIDLVAFHHPKKSRIDIIQALCRALRRPLGSDKEFGYILLPLYVSKIEDGGLEQALRKSGYNVIWEVIQSLREQDEVVESALHEAALQRARGEKINLDFLTVTGPFVHLDLLREVISTTCVDVLRDSWYEKHAILQRRFAEGFGANVPHDCIIEGVRIGDWAMHQRTVKRKGKLSPGKVVALESIGFVWDVLDANWQKFFAIKKKQHQEGKNVNGHSTSVIDGKSVGRWDLGQRRKYKRGTLAQDKVAALESIGFTWDILDAKWEAKSAILVQIHAEGKNVNLSKNCIINGEPIGRWAVSLRKAYKAGTLSEAKVKLLERMGFEWHIRDAVWGEHAEILERRFREGISVNVSQGVVIDGKPIGHWTSTQRMMKKAGKLPPHQVARLDAIGFSWCVFDAKREEKLATLERRFQAGEKVNVANDVVVSGKRIGNWATRLRRLFKAGKLDDIEISRLEAIGFQWDAKEVAAKGVQCETGANIYPSNQLSGWKFVRAYHPMFSHPGAQSSGCDAR